MIMIVKAGRCSILIRFKIQWNPFAKMTFNSRGSTCGHCIWVLWQEAKLSSSWTQRMNFYYCMNELIMNPPCAVR